jgi:hypothetical protein
MADESTGTIAINMLMVKDYADYRISANTPFRENGLVIFPNPDISHFRLRSADF